MINVTGLRDSCHKALGNRPVTFAQKLSKDLVRDDKDAEARQATR